MTTLLDRPRSSTSHSLIERPSAKQLSLGEQLASQLKRLNAPTFDIFSTNRETCVRQRTYRRESHGWMCILPHFSGKPGGLLLAVSKTGGMVYTNHIMTVARPCTALVSAHCLPLGDINCTERILVVTDSFAGLDDDVIQQAVKHCYNPQASRSR